MQGNLFLVCERTSRPSKSQGPSLRFAHAPGRPPVLTGLLLQNIALIETLELSFGPGFTVLNGETGAG
ncbi:MAG: hypothetical protein ACK55I_39435, partial [bacterium]